MKRLKDNYGGHSMAYYGGGGQGNHLGGAYASSLRAAMDTPFVYSSLAQEILHAGRGAAVREIESDPPGV